MTREAAETLRVAGIGNPLRVVKLMRDAIANLELDLSGMTVLTEAASGPYVVTPVIAALAGASKVLATTRDSQYASVDAVITQTRSLGSLCQLGEDKIEIHAERSKDLFAQADIITNLGFVRPIDCDAVGAMKPSAVIALMCEAWEFRPGDVDLDACRRKGIIVLATDEEHPKVNVFDYSGWLSLKMLFDAQIEVHKSRIVIVSSDKFGLTIERRLKSYGAYANLVSDLSSADNRGALVDCDAIVIADYSRDDQIIGVGGDIEAADLVGLAPHATVIQYAGRVGVEELNSCGATVYPAAQMDAHRMAFTLASLGPRPVIELHSAGLKVGQALAQARLRERMNVDEAVRYALHRSPAQMIT